MILTTPAVFMNVIYIAASLLIDTMSYFNESVMDVLLKTNDCSTFAHN